MLVWPVCRKTPYKPHETTVSKANTSQVIPGPCGLSGICAKTVSSPYLYFKCFVRNVPAKVRMIARILLIALCATIFSACATQNVQTRKQERYAAYSQLSPEF